MAFRTIVITLYDTANQTKILTSHVSSVVRCQAHITKGLVQLINQHVRLFVHLSYKSTVSYLRPRRGLVSIVTNIRHPLIPPLRSILFFLETLLI